MDTFWPALILTCVSIVFVVVSSRKPRRRLPPGPPSIPILGSIHHAPRGGNEAAVYGALGKTYGGSMLHFRAFYRHIIILNSWEACVTLLESRGARFSDRPSFPMTELMGWDWMLPSMRYGPRLREGRALVQQWFSPVASLGHQSIQRAANAIYLDTLISDSDNFSWNMRRMAAATILRVTHGFDIRENNDPLIVLADNAMRSLSAAGPPGTYAVDWMPFLKHVPDWLPGAGFKRKAKEWKKLADAVINEPFERWLKGKANDALSMSMTEDMLEKREQTNQHIDAVKGAAAIAYVAGADTSVNTINYLVQAMVLNPRVQKKAQDEIDRVVGSSRLPDFQDQSSLPYVEAIIRETMRLYPALPLGVPHAALEEDEYEGMYIPKGAYMIPNVWSLFRDPMVYPNPDEFVPERHINSSGEIDCSVPNPHTIAFGFGRRICPGRHFANATVWLAAVRLLACFEFQPAVDENGVPCPPSNETEWGGVLSRPKSFKCTITPRSEKVRSLIRDEIATAE